MYNYAKYAREMHQRSFCQRIELEEIQLEHQFGLSDPGVVLANRNTTRRYPFNRELSVAQVI